MASNIDQSRGRAAMVYTGAVPWHGLGKHVDGALTTAEAFKQAEMDFTVVKLPVFVEVGGKRVPVKGRWGVARTDTGKVFDKVAVSDRWVPFQNADGASALDILVQDKSAYIETAGVIKGGAQVWMLAKLDHLLRVKGEDVHETYLLWTNGHDGKRMNTYAITTIRVVCQNTITAAIAQSEASGQVTRYRHTGNMKANLDEARQLLGLTNKSLIALQEKMNALADVKVKNNAELDAFLQRLGFNPDAELGLERSRFDAVKHSFEEGAGSNLVSARGTWWGAVCAVTDFADHYGKRDTNTQKENNFVNTMMGSASRVKNEAVERALVAAGLV